MKKLVTTACIILCIVIQGNAQYTTLNAHSHNDYEQKDPFFLAYRHHFGSIEADIWEIKGDLLVAHDQKSITPQRSLDVMYINPIVQLFGQNGGKAWSDQAGSFLLLIDVKSDYKTTLPLLVEKIKKYPEVFDPKVNKNAVRVVITGNRPDPADFIQYPEVISFDGKFNLKYDEQQLKRVALYSENLWVFTQWKGKDSIPVKDLVRLKFVIDSVHCLKSAVRFWNAPDNLIAWKTLMDLKVDYINTDHINELSDFLSTK